MNTYHAMEIIGASTSARQRLLLEEVVWDLLDSRGQMARHLQDRV